MTNNIAIYRAASRDENYKLWEAIWCFILLANEVLASVRTRLQLLPDKEMYVVIKAITLVQVIPVGYSDWKV